jgi:hypothetical protein
MADAEKIEGELNALVREGFTERSAIAFIMTVQTLRKVMPEATVEGVFNLVMEHGTAMVLHRFLHEKSNAKHRGRSKSAGRLAGPGL